MKMQVGQKTYKMCRHTFPFINSWLLYQHSSIKKNVLCFCLICFEVKLLRVHSSPMKSGKGLAHDILLIGNYAKHASHVNDIKDTDSQSNKMAALVAGFRGIFK